MRKGQKTPKLGQHFLRGTWAASALVEAASIQRGDVVVEIGPGGGVLTKELLSLGARVIAIEKDEGLAKGLEGTFASEITEGALRIVVDDVRNITPEELGLKNGKYAVAANIPYYITGEILRMFLSADTQPHTIALLVQKEVAQRIVSKKESILSLSVKAYGTPRIVAKVSRGNFSPPPSVDSAILAITNVSKKLFGSVDEKLFFTLVRAGFSSKRKLLAGNLSALAPKTSVLESFAHCSIPEKARAEDVPLEKWMCLAKSLSKD